MQSFANSFDSPWNFLNTSGEVARLCRELDWSRTALGPISFWDQSLRSTIGLLLRSAFPIFVSWGPERVLIYNDAYARLMGPLKHPLALGAKFRDVWPEIWPDLEPTVLAVDRGESQYFEDRKLLVDRTGSLAEAYFTFSYSPLLDDDGKIGGLFCNVVETTKTVESRRELERAEKQVTDILEGTNEGFFSVDKSWVVTRVNSNHVRLTQKPREAQLGQNFLELFFPERSQRETLFWKSYHRAMNERVSVVFEDYYAPLKIWASVSVYPQPDGGLAVFFRNINEEKRIQREIVKAKEEAERANRLKSAFLANVSHEIRTPLGAMMGFADLLRDEEITDEERANYIQILNRSGHQLSRVINDIMDLSKVETGHVDFEYRRHDPRQIGTEVVSLMSILAKEKNLKISFAAEESAPREVVTDVARVKQVLNNLVENAIKFTREGSVQLRMKADVDPEGNRACVYEVIDTGIGIADEAKEGLFRIFNQADNSLTRHYGGTGLGLALSRSLARAMGGEVSLRASSQETGTIFEFRLPHGSESAAVGKPSAVEGRPDAVSPEGNLRGVSILLVEDLPDNQHLISLYLRKEGASVDIAGNGHEGMVRARAGRYDLILMDLQMPVMDGYTAAAQLRSEGDSRPIVALTAHAMTDVRQKCEEIGFSAHLPKPIKPRELVETILRLTR